MSKKSCTSSSVIGRHHKPGRVSEGGQVIPIVAILLGFMVVATLVVMRVGSEANTAASVQTAADAAALAGIGAGAEDDARKAAEANGARLVQFRSEAGAAFVEVSKAGRTADARAELRGGLDGG